MIFVLKVVYFFIFSTNLLFFSKKHQKVIIKNRSGFFIVHIIKYCIFDKKLILPLLYIAKFYIKIEKLYKPKKMKQLILIISLIGFSQAASAQLSVVENVIQVACKEFNTSKIPVSDMMEEEVQQIFIESRQSYLSAWDSTQRAFTQQVLLPFKYDEYFVRRLETECPSFRPAMPYFDTYLINQPEKRALYLKAKALIHAMEDGKSDAELASFLDVQAPITKAFWDITRKEIDNQKETSTLNFIMLDDYTFRCEYSDYITTEKNFRIDFIFADGSDDLINNIRITTKFALEQGYDSIDVSFDIDETPPFTGQK